MRRSLPIAAVAATAVLISVFLADGCGRSGASAPATSIDHRYSTQMCEVPGVLAPFFAITDHRDQKLYLYSAEKNGLALHMSVDLTKTGQPTIEVQKASEPSTRPAEHGR